MIVPLRAGDDGVEDTLAAMATYATTRSTHPEIVRLARRIGADVGGDTRARPRIARLRAWLGDRLSFAPDPVDVEWVDDPIDQLDDLKTLGRIHGDCDDAATLGATLARAMGLPARFVVAGFGPPPAPYAHVWTEVTDGQRWYDLDVTREPDTLPPTRRAVYTLDSGVLMPHYDPYRSTSYPMSRAMGYNPYQDNMLGIIPAVPVVIATAGPKIAAWIAAIKPFAALFGGGKEPDRIRMTDAMYQEAIRGNQVALLYLRQRTGNYGVIPIEGHGQVGGWGSGTARTYASQRYQEALTALGQTGPNLVDVPGVGPVGVPQDVKEAGIPVALAIGLGLLLLAGRKRRS
ncbi:MAG: transglutaminase-like domain-containing protein [Tepidisphaeraceae bacterium]